MTRRSYEISWLDPVYMRDHPDCDLANATRCTVHTTRAVAISQGRRIARKIRGTVYLQVFIETRFGPETEGAMEEIGQ